MSQDVGDKIGNRNELGVALVIAHGQFDPEFLFQREDRGGEIEPGNAEALEPGCAGEFGWAEAGFGGDDRDDLVRAGLVHRWLGEVPHGLNVGDS